MSIEIRNYQESDYAELIGILHNVYDSEISQEVLEENYISINKSIIVAVEDYKHIVGCTFIEIQKDYVRPRKIAFVSYVAVDEKYRKLGIGSKLLFFVEDLCKKQNCSAIELTSANFRKGAHDFYKSIGYSVKNTTVFIKEII